MRLSIRVKLLGGFLLIAAAMAIIIVVSILSLRNISQNVAKLTDQDLVVSSQAQELRAIARSEQQLITNYALTGNPASKQELDVARKQFDDKVTAITPLLEGDEISLMQEVSIDEDRVISSGNAMADKFLQGDRDGGLTDMEAFDAAANKFIGQLDAVADSASASAETLQAKIEKTEADASRTGIIIGVVSLVFALAVGIYLSQTISGGVKAVARAAEGLAMGEIDQELDDIRSKDELGDMMHSFKKLIAYMQEIAGVANKMAHGDLSTNVTPRSDDDTLNNAFSSMVILLRELLQEVAQTAGNVSAASTQLSAASDQTSSATEQVATTVQQIAQGTIEQNKGISQTTHNLDQLGQAVDGVAQGAQEQAGSAAKTSQLTAQVNTIIHQVTESAQNGAASAADAIETARKGSQTIDKSMARMKNIQETVNFSAGKVEEMGVRSAEIGAIIETIDDIAAQTNLLALNAAIEAARAGEHGKGFAVVADEVRKLAEKAAGATKEITDLISNIQGTVSEAIVAMQKNAEEVSAGVQDSDEAGKALKNITDAIGDVNQQVEDIAAAAEEMSANSNELLEAIETVSAVIEENTAATEEMSANSSEVMEALETMVSVSEENSAAIEEVSAAVEEVSAQSEEVSASADELNEMAGALTALVSQFTLADSQGISQQVELYKQAHLRWVDRLHKMLNGRLKLDETTLDDHTACILGQWYYERGQADYSDVKVFQAVETPHIHIHKTLKEAVRAFNTGDIDTARRKTAEVENLSHQVVEALNQLEKYIDKNAA